MRTLLKEMRISQLSSSNELTLVTYILHSTTVVMLICTLVGKNLELSLMFCKFALIIITPDWSYVFINLSTSLRRTEKEVSNLDDFHYRCSYLCDFHQYVISINTIPTYAISITTVSQKVPCTSRIDNKISEVSN